ncbi:hypothetical protein Hanom_Chr12g01147561 [Helianthus anomalus]
MEDLEEGEIKQGDAGGNVDAQNPVVDMTDEVVTDKSESLPTENGEVQENQGPLEDQQSNVFNVGGKNQSMNRKEDRAAHANGNIDVHGVDYIFNNNVGGDVDINVGDYKSINNNEENVQPGLDSLGPTGELVGEGPTPLVSFRKRNREDRSPPSIGSTQGPSQRSHCNPASNNIEPLDLNTPVRAEQGDVGSVNGGTDILDGMRCWPQFTLDL